MDGLQSAYVAGYTQSSDFPTQDPYQAGNAGSTDAFVVRFSPSGSSLFYSTYLGGSNSDQGHGIALDITNAAYVIGYTQSSDFPTWNPYQSSMANGSQDAFVSKLVNDNYTFPLTTITLPCF